MNKISEKAVWDDLVPSDDEKLSSPSYGQPIQSQMMFCYKCSQLIPANSAFCPWCQTELFVTCPKCGYKYSSQYPSCNQCGTNREQYMLEMQRLEERRFEELRREEIEEQERQEECRRREEEEARKLDEKRKYDYLLKRAVDEKISTTAEYMQALSFLFEIREFYIKKKRKESRFFTISNCVMIDIILVLLVYLIFDSYLDDTFINRTIILALSIAVVLISLLYSIFKKIKPTKRDLFGIIPKIQDFKSYSIDSYIKNLVFGHNAYSNFDWQDESLKLWLIYSYRREYDIEDDSVPYSWLDVKPSFPSSEIDFSTWIYKNVKYPEEAKANGIQGEVVVTFTVNKLGYIENVNIKQSVHPLLDSEVLRVISESPKWSPGRFKGIAIPVTYQHTETFKI